MEIILENFEPLIFENKNCGKFIDENNIVLEQLNGNGQIVEISGTFENEKDIVLGFCKCYEEWIIVYEDIKIKLKKKK